MALDTAYELSFDSEPSAWVGNGAGDYACAGFDATVYCAGESS